MIKTTIYRQEITTLNLAAPNNFKMYIANIDRITRKNWQSHTQWDILNNSKNGFCTTVALSTHSMCSVHHTCISPLPTPQLLRDVQGQAHGEPQGGQSRLCWRGLHWDRTQMKTRESLCPPDQKPKPMVLWSWSVRCCPPLGHTQLCPACRRGQDAGLEPSDPHEAHFSHDVLS